MESRGERLRQALEARGIRKQLALAAELGVDESAISRWQRNAGLSLMHAARLCEVLDISLDWLILGRGDMQLHHRSDTNGSAGQVADRRSSLPPSIANAVRQLTEAILAELS